MRVTSYVRSLFLLFIFLFGFPPLAHAGSIYLSPGSRTVAPGSTFSVGVRANMGGDLVNAAEANLTYPTDKLDFVSISAGGSAFPIDASSGGGSGGVRLSRGVIGQGVSGDKLIGTVTFRAKASITGTASIGVSGSLVRGTDQANVYSGGAGSTITISGSAATTTNKSTTAATQKTTLTPTPSPLPIEITDISVTDIGFTKATIRFTTNREIPAQVEFGMTEQYGLISQESKAATTHEIVLSSSFLSPGTTYHFRVKSANPEQEATSQDMTFKTKGLTAEFTLVTSSQSPIANQQVQLITPFETVSGTTNSQGKVTFTDLPATQHTLTAEVLGEKIVQTVTLTQPSDKDIASGTPPIQQVQIKVAGVSTKRLSPLLTIASALIPLLLLGGLVWYLWSKRRNKPVVITQPQSAPPPQPPQVQ